MRLGRQTGSLVTHVLTTSAQPVPTVGMAATVCGWTDRYPGTVIEVRTDRKGVPTHVRVQEDHAVRTDRNGMSEAQTYAYSRNPEGALWDFKLHRGEWRYLALDRMSRRGHGPGLVLGHREKYWDPSF